MSDQKKVKAENNLIFQGVSMAARAQIQQVNPFVRDENVERWLTNFNVRWDGPIDVPVDSINLRESRRNQARPTAIVAEAVDTYVIAMSNGDRFPACVVYQTANGYVFIDGVNRYTAAHKFGATHIKCYLVSADTPSQLIGAMTVSANVRNGHGVEKKWRVIQAESLISLYGFTIDQACALQSVRPSDVRNYQKLVEVNNMAERAGISSNLWNELSETSRITMLSIGNAEVFAAAATVVVQHQIPAGGPINAFVKNIREALKISQNEAMAVISETAESLERNAVLARNQGRKHSSAPQLGFLTGVGKVLNTDPEKFNRSFITDSDREVAADRLDKLIRHAARLRMELLGRIRVGNDLVDIASEIERG